jgi:hypothetical protein
MVATQITRIMNSDGSQTLKKYIDGATLTTMLSGVTNLRFALKKIFSNGYAISLYSTSSRSNRVYCSRL